MAINHKRYSRAFALPTVMITSVVMILLLSVALASVGSITASINNQLYDKLAKEASEAGLTMATACLANVDTPTWSNSSPLRPNTDCGGGTICSPTDQVDPSKNCYVLTDANIRSTFSVDAPTLNSDGSYSVAVHGKVELLRTSNHDVWQTYTQNLSEHLPMSVSSITGGNDTLCTIRNGLLYCWGRGTEGQIGNGKTSSQTTPYRVQFPTYVTHGSTTFSSSRPYVEAVTTGVNHTCAIVDANQNPADDNLTGNFLFCWGDNSNYQFGPSFNGQYTSDTGPATTPQLLDTRGTSYWISNRYFKSLSARSNTCVITAPVTGSAYTSVNYNSNLDLSPQSEYCWGQNSQGQSGETGYGTTPNVIDPKNVYGAPIRTGSAASTTLSYVNQINSVSGNMGCSLVGSSATAATGSVYCWGSNVQGENGFGNDGTGGGARSQGIAGTNGATKLNSATKVLTNNSVACGLQSGNIYCWGNNAVGQSTGGWFTINSDTSSVSDGVGGTTWRTAQYVDSPSLVATSGPLSHTGSYASIPVTDIAFADWAGCGVAGGSVYCWGDNYYGELGRGDDYMVAATHTPYPSPYTPGSTPITSGQIVPASNPVKVGGKLTGQTVTSISASNGGFCVTTATAQVYCWGDNYNGQLAIGTISRGVSSPVQVRSLGSYSY